MPVTVDVDYKNTISSARNVNATFDYLSNWERAIPDNFPGLAAFEKTETDTYRWQFEKLEYASHKLELQFVTKFSMVPPETVAMQSHPGQGSQVSGQWKVTAVGNGSEVQFGIRLALELPIPFFLKGMAAPIAQKEMKRLFDRYLANVGKTLSS